MSRFDEALYKIAMVRDQGGVEVSQDLIKIIVDELPGLYKEPSLIDLAGEAVIIKAFYPELQCYVAIKVLLPVAPPPKKQWWKKKEKQHRVNNIREHQKRFIRSITLQRTLYEIIKKENLQNVCGVPQVYRELYGDANSPKFAYVMEYIEGLPVVEWCKRTASDIEVLGVYEKMLLALMHCFHSYAIVHTDLKPSNVLVSSNRPVFLDFGIAKCLSDTERIITTVKTVEMHSGMFTSERQKAFPNLRGYYEDIFSMGVLLHCMLNREIPLDVGDMRVQMLFPPSALPFEFQQFYRSCIEETKTPFTNICDMFEQFSSIYKNFKNVIVRKEKSENTALSVNLEVIEHVKPKYQKAISHLLEAFRNM